MTLKTNSVYISVIIPALNEEKILPDFLEQVIVELNGSLQSYELILVDDGSQDATGLIMDSYALKHVNVKVLHNHGNIGFGASYKAGVHLAKGEYIGLLCGDAGLPAKSFSKLFSHIGSADILIPWIINLKEIKSTKRYYLSRTYTVLLNLFFGLHIKYYNGLALHKAKILKSLKFSDDGFGFQAEILIKLIKSGYSYIEIGVEGAEIAHQSDAVRLKNWLRIFTTVSQLIGNIRNK